MGWQESIGLGGQVRLVMLGRREEEAGGDGARPPLRRSVTSREQGNDGATQPPADDGRWHDSDMDSSCHNATAKMLATAPARGNVMNTSKPLAFSIERIMARTPEPKPCPSPTSCRDPCPRGPQHSLHLRSSIPCMIPFVPVAYDTNPKAGMTGSGPQASLEAPGAPALNTRSARARSAAATCSTAR